MKEYFFGWYFRQQNEHQTLAVIPSFHKSDNNSYFAIQLITNHNAFHIPFSASEGNWDTDGFKIGNNSFHKSGFTIELHSSELDAFGSVQFKRLTPLRYDIMGPFRYAPLLQCRHSIYSMYHLVDGMITINKVPYLFQDAAGYMEGDRGKSFPEHYFWFQCSTPNGAAMLSIADIPFCGFCFTGVIGILWINGKEHRIATYLGAKAEKITPQEIFVRQGRYLLELNPSNMAGHPLQAPEGGYMGRVIYEHPSCSVRIRFTENNNTLLQFHAKNAAFEYEY